MKLKSYKELLKEDHITRDENSIHPLGKYREEEEGDEYFGDQNEDDFFGEEEEEYDGEEEEDYLDEPDEEASDDDLLSHVASLIRQMIKNVGISDFWVTTNEYDLSIQFVLNKTERFNKLMKIMGIVKKLTTDTLIQYDSEIDLWETKDGRTLLTFEFYYDSEKTGSEKSDNVPF